MSHGCLDGEQAGFGHGVRNLDRYALHGVGRSVGEGREAGAEQLVHGTGAGGRLPGVRELKSGNGSADSIWRWCGEVVGEQRLRAGDPVGDDNESLADYLRLDRNWAAHPGGQELVGAGMRGHSVEHLVSGGLPEMLLAGQRQLDLLHVGGRWVRAVVATNDGCDVAGTAACPGGIGVTAQ